MAHRRQKKKPKSHTPVRGFHNLPALGPFGTEVKLRGRSDPEAAREAAKAEQSPQPTENPMQSELIVHSPPPAPAAPAAVPEPESASILSFVSKDPKKPMRAHWCPPPPTGMALELCALVRQRRLELKWTKQELADKAWPVDEHGVRPSASVVHSIETGGRAADLNLIVKCLEAMSWKVRVNVAHVDTPWS